MLRSPESVFFVTNRALFLVYTVFFYLTSHILVQLRLKAEYTGALLFLSAKLV